MRALKACFGTALLAAVLTSCDVHEFPGGEPGKQTPEILLQFDDGEMPLLTEVTYDPTSRSRSSAHASRFIVQVFSDNDIDGARGASRSPLHTAVMTDADTAFTRDRVVSLPLEAGSYRILVWADYVEAATESDRYYTTEDLSEISLVSSSGKDDDRYFHQGNTPWREAYRGERRISVNNDGSVRHSDGTPAPAGRAVVEMSRPMAQFAFVTTDLADFSSRNRIKGKDGALPDLSAYKIVLRYTSYMPSVYNAHTDKPVNSRIGVSFEAKPETLDGSRAILGYDHVLVNHSNTSVQVALEVHDKTTGEPIASTSPIEIPLQRNHLTIVSGPFLTTKSGTGVGINPGYFDDFNIEIR